MKFYSMKNKFQDTFNTPFPASNDAEAIYQIRIVINQKREPEIIAEDFSLFYVGEFNDSGIFKTEGLNAVESPVDGTILYEPICLVEDCSTLRVKKEGVVNE